MSTATGNIVQEVAEDNGSRRGFLAAAIAAGAAYAGAIAYPVYQYLASPIEQSAALAKITEVSLKDAQKLAPGSVLMFKFGTQPAMLIHHKDGQWTGLGAVCSHLGCTVQYQPGPDKIHCFCHGGEYDPYTGANIAGPPPRPLRKFAVKLTEDAVVVSRV